MVPEGGLSKKLKSMVEKQLLSTLGGQAKLAALIIASKVWPFKRACTWRLMEVCDYV